MNKHERQMVVAVKLREAIIAQRRQQQDEATDIAKELNDKYEHDREAIREALKEIRIAFTALKTKMSADALAKKVRISANDYINISSKGKDEEKRFVYAESKYDQYSHQFDYGDIEKSITSSAVVERCLAMRNEKDPKIQAIIEKGLALITGGTDEDVEAFMKL